MTNPFEDARGTYLVLANDQEQYSLWPSAIDVPAGWRTVLDAAPRQKCVEYIDTHWVDLRPKDLRGATPAGS
ncbi:MULTISPECIES: MbtH family protein [unclassified Streptomyces]|uniref:MbtH family protein n=1 Tax=unclassified Streptomyces TaxID=2593676 RepID=UPI001F0459D3|nr:MULTISPECIES: MbtH family protein [unclassified Streptomyces]MCH0561805.1 MbtH family protein [Streptomyces sp. MUM 2J]MCH0568882.1 MbtH family protein [Streptomyces sp. MUM 136J]